MAADTRVKVRFAAREYLAELDGGRILVTHHGRRVVDEVSPQAGKAIISAVCELERLQDRILAEGVPHRQALGLGAAKVPFRVPIEDGKYEFRCKPYNSSNVCLQEIRRHGEPWIYHDELQHADFWFTIAGALQDARERLAAHLARPAAEGPEPGRAP